MASIYKELYDDEEIQMVFRKHPIVMRKGLILFMFALLVGMIPSLIEPRIDYFWYGLAGGFVLGIIVMMPSWIYWYFSVYIVTDQRFIQVTQRGFFRRSFADIGIHQIQSINYHIIGLQETLLKFGTIVIQTYLGDNTIYDVHHPEKVAKELNQVLREYGSVTQTPDPASTKSSHER